MAPDSAVLGLYDASFNQGMRKAKASYELYDFRTDPGEAKNMTSDHPALVSSLSEHMANECERLSK